MRPISYLFFYSVVAISQSALSSDTTITLAEANARALERHPSLQIFDAEKRLADAKILSALAKPNPELEFETEDVLGTGIYERFDSAIYNLGLSQLIELGGKRQGRAEVARSSREAEDLRFEAAKREVMLETTRRFVLLLAAQDSETTALQNLKIDEETVQSVKGLKEGGRGSAIDVGQSELGMRESKLQVEVARGRTMMARQQLASMWRETKPSFAQAAGRLSKPAASIPSSGKLQAALENHPAVTLARSGIRTAQRELNLQQRNRKPDLSLGLAWRRDTEVGDNAVVLNFSLPLPLFNRNEGGIAEAEAGIERIEALVEQVRQELSATLAEAVTRLEMTRAQYELVSGEMLSAAVAHHEMVSEGYRLGRLSYQELLESRRSLTAVRGQRIEALAAYHEARVEIETLTGISL